MTCCSRTGRWTPSCCGPGPAVFELDLFDGQAWIAVVAFRMTNVAPRGIPALPWVSAFPELNVRTYVRAGGKPGVYFFSLDAANPVAVLVARTLAHLPYHTASMSVEERDGGFTTRAAAFVAQSQSGGSSPRAIGRSATCRSRQRALDSGSLTERYCLFTVDGSFHARRLDIHHPPWPLQRAEAEITVNTMAEASGLTVPPVAPLLHFAKRQDMVGWPLMAVD